MTVKPPYSQSTIYPPCAAYIIVGIATSVVGNVHNTVIVNLQNPVAEVINNFWGIMQPLLFGLIGTEIRIEKINMSLIGQGMGVLMFGLFVS